MDPRIEEHAELVVDKCVDVQPGDEVVVAAPHVAEDLVVALFEQISERGANVTFQGRSDRARRARLRALDPDDVTESAVTRAISEAVDVFVQIRASENTRETGDADPAVISALQRANAESNRRFMRSRWCLTQYPAPGDAQAAEMSTDAYEDFVWSAINRDWDTQREFQEQLVEILDDADEVHIKSRDTTDLRLSISGMKAINDTATKNLPGGEVFTAPVPESVDGEVTFDMPVITRGREIQNASLRFEGGEVVDFDADQNVDVLEAVLDTDEGARRLGELGVGMNRAIDRFSYNMLFDEKMGDTVHLAIGRAIEECVPEGQSANESATHLDMIVDMSEDSVIEVDGDVIQRNGTFAFEDGFE